MRFMSLYHTLFFFYALADRIKYALIRRMIVAQLRRCGENVYIDGRESHFEPRLISIGSDVHIGPGADFGGLSKPITIGNKVLIGPLVSIRTDNHNISNVGQFMYDAHERRSQDEGAVVIEDDVWIGTRVVILHGVTLHRGAVVAAGAVVTRDVPPYAIVGGVPAQVIRYRFDAETIKKHETMLYPGNTLQAGLPEGL